MTLVLSLATPGPGFSGTHLGSIRTWLHCSLTGTHLDLLTLFFTWATPGPSEYAPSGPHLDLVTLVPTWASSGHGSTAWPAGWHHLDLVTLVPTCTSSGHGSSAWREGWPLVDLVSLVATCASPIPGDTGPTCSSLGTSESVPFLVLTRN